MSKFEANAILFFLHCNFSIQNVIVNISCSYRKRNTIQFDNTWVWKECYILVWTVGHVRRSWIHGSAVHILTGRNDVYFGVTTGMNVTRSKKAGFFLYFLKLQKNQFEKYHLPDAIRKLCNHIIKIHFKA